MRWSLSARRAWIEIDLSSKLGNGLKVALRKESVDRNRVTSKDDKATPVALRKESVDRNSRLICLRAKPVTSLSARRAWIEMPTHIF